ncbi:MAG TPA: SIMPL domain-containing protein [Gaiellaceae bacterium]|jgi:uncharacterized protein YggE|nr:SIMPL domain-containing protein [Gaiellaceae bacterium]
MTPTRRILVLCAAAAALGLIVLLAGAGRPEAARGGDTQPPTDSLVTTSGHGVVSTVPDRATISAGVRVEADTATDALARCSAAATRVVAALKAHGGQNVQTREVSLDPQTNDAGKTTGYVAENTVTAVASVATVGGLIDAATAAGATSIDGPALTVSDSTALYRQALAAAVADARAKADVLAKAGGSTVGPVVSMSETSSGNPVPFAGSGAVAKDTPVEAGTQEVTADVQVEFRLG